MFRHRLSLRRFNPKSGWIRPTHRPCRPMLARRALDLTQLRPIPPKSIQIWPIPGQLRRRLADFGPTSVEIGPDVVKHGRLLASDWKIVVQLAQISPIAYQICPMWVGVARQMIRFPGDCGRIRPYVSTQGLHSENFHGPRVDLGSVWAPSIGRVFYGGLFWAPSGRDACRFGVDFGADLAWSRGRFWIDLGSGVKLLRIKTFRWVAPRLGLSRARRDEVRTMCSHGQH